MNVFFFFSFINLQKPQSWTKSLDRFWHWFISSCRDCWRLIIPFADLEVKLHGYNWHLKISVWLRCYLYLQHDAWLELLKQRGWVNSRNGNAEQVEMHEGFLWLWLYFSYVQIKDSSERFTNSRICPSNSWCLSTSDFIVNRSANDSLNEDVLAWVIGMWGWSFSWSSEGCCFFLSFLCKHIVLNFEAINLCQRDLNQIKYWFKNQWMFATFIISATFLQISKKLGLIY